MSRRAALAGFGAFAASGVLAACGSNTGRGSSGDLTVWFHEYGEKGTGTALRRYASGFPGGGVSTLTFPGDYDQKVASALIGDSGPDVFEFANGPTIDMITAGQVADLTDLLGDARSDFNPALLDRMTYRGKVYGIPQVMDVQVLVYRKSMLQKAGVRPPRTVDELVSAAEELNQGTTKGLFLGNNGGADVLGGVLLWSSGHDYLTPDRKPGFVNEDVASGLRTMRKLFTSGNLLLGAPQDWSDPGAFIAGLTAMQWTGLWALPAITEALGDDVGVRAFPAIGTNGGDSVPFGAYGSAVSTKGDLAKAKKFVQWLWVERSDLQLDWAQGYGLHVPARRSLVPQANKLSTGVYNEASKLVYSVGRPQTPLLWTPRSSTAYRDALDRVIRGGADPMTELRGVADVVERELDRFPA
ncbi:Extracellular solute-binding protein family 1 OS=Tsukamurella paurometabola (strain ATCC 8368 / DSM / CCUG 35730 / CIP 100753 / JCM 10117 / KCTC 9821 /NBRC 16120 / NCIMB 702349 / NCTC 13040) OX=521096 GN=Tpau_1269 PE=4 SV=1 [Tsukamurella paurometabola]|uniref:Extracellular solute-binding protein family 1 n=1 Tax=Tsukamurella paurometabola (strain ATCC 8368 / DSM 20162 / CCUG 35730 / CIP 100753 / JCM 10117 / KCTC 9821 / NBRC 16120 / NCIMB 702349 / NCTC 13040) TaxID=521096 RepID=D5UWM8_TSUPD|nr:extracellular solute-binding protein [Tsukamurella paurometabola]ADG77900.1 extracellular solute-binding protein family 1 [Tsukamurella paurometabola DSM 20162]SUP29266.1 Lactose-binding protein precursor [Tsukamurella paurometabola]